MFHIKHTYIICQCFISMFRKLYIHMFHTYPIHPDSDRDNYQCFSNPFFYLPSIYHRFKNNCKTSMLDSATLAKHQFSEVPCSEIYNLHPKPPSSWIHFPETKRVSNRPSSFWRLFTTTILCCIRERSLRSQLKHVGFAREVLP